MLVLLDQAAGLRQIRIYCTEFKISYTLSNDMATLGDVTLASSATVKNLGVIFDQDVSFNSHIKRLLSFTRVIL